MMQYSNKIAQYSENQKNVAHSQEKKTLKGYEIQGDPDIGINKDLKADVKLCSVM